MRKNKHRTINIMRKLKGTIVSDKMDKTRVIAVTRLVKHSRYQKYYKITKRFKAHDEHNTYHTGDVVIISEVRPLSKDKRWRIMELVQGRVVDSTDKT